LLIPKRCSVDFAWNVSPSLLNGIVMTEDDLQLDAAIAWISTIHAKRAAGKEEI
jgi:hypothetical protein